MLKKKEESLVTTCFVGSLESVILSRSFPIHGISLLGTLRFPLEVDIVGRLMITRDILVLLNVIASLSEKAGQLVRQIYDSWTYHKGVKSQILYNLHGACNLCSCKKAWYVLHRAVSLQS